MQEEPLVKKHLIQQVLSSIELIANTKLLPEKAIFLGENPEDLMPVMAARVSHGQDNKTGKDLAKDEKLIKFLAEHNHTSPFEHLSATFRITCPIYVAREWMRHRTQSFNEISFRYTSDIIGQVYFPEEWRKQDENNRQVGLENLDKESMEAAEALLSLSYRRAIADYDALCALGVCREQARSVIPVGHITHFYASANLLNWAKFCKLRCAKDAQEEIRTLSKEVSKILTELYPMPWKYLNAYKQDI